MFVRRAALRGLELEVAAIGLGETPAPGEHDLLYVGGGQDREQALIAPDIAAKGPALAEAVAGGAAVLAVCGGYQLLGRFYRDRYGSELPGAGVLPLHTVAGDRRMIGDVLLECSFDPAADADARGLREPRRPDDPRRGCGAARPRDRRLRERRDERVRGLPGRPRRRHLPARPAAAAEPVARGLAARAGGRPSHGRRAARFEPLDDRLEAEAHAVSAARARSAAAALSSALRTLPVRPCPFRP